MLLSTFLGVYGIVSFIEDINKLFNKDSWRPCHAKITNNMPHMNISSNISDDMISNK